MNNSRILRRVFVLTALLVLSSAIAAGIYTRSSKSQKQKEGVQAYDAPKVTEIPEVVSHIEGLQIAGVTLINQGTQAAALDIDVINHRDEAVMALDFVAGSKGDWSGLLFSGFWDEDNPRVIIPPHTLKTFTVYLGGIYEGPPITVAAAIFSDGKEEGEKRFLDGIRKGRLHDQEKRRTEKAKNGGPQ